MLLQFTGLALSIAAIITGGLIAELMFSYPGLGTLLFNAIGQNDYPVRIDTPGERIASAAASCSMSWEPCWTECSRQELDVLSMMMVEIQPQGVPR